jgi:hypothetical protein
MPNSNEKRNKLKNKNYQSVGTVPKPDRKIVERS